MPNTQKADCTIVLNVEPVCITYYWGECEDTLLSSIGGFSYVAPLAFDAVIYCDSHGLDVDNK